METGTVETPLSVVYQPIVDLRSHEVVAVEALARGPRGSPLESPVALFAAARPGPPGSVQRLDEKCLGTALAGVPSTWSPATVFVNVEPATIGVLGEDCLAGLDALVPAGVRVVIEVTERALLDSPAQLLVGLGLARKLGWGVAIDDVGADPAALAILPFLSPDVIKLDLSLVRARPNLEIAAIVNAVNAEAERSGAFVLAEGIESQEHLDRALSMGARLGQGWFFGGPLEVPAPCTAPLRLTPPRPRATARTPFEVLSGDTDPRRIAAPLLAAMTRHVEHQAMLLDGPAVVLSSFQHVRHFTRATRLRYEGIAARAALTAVLGQDMPDEPAPGVHGSSFEATDPLVHEWVLTVVSPHFSAAIAAQELPERTSDGERRFSYVLTYNRERVVAAAALLLERVRPLGAALSGPSSAAPDSSTPASEMLAGTPDLPDLLLRAISTASNGITISDASDPALPLVYANRTFSRLTQYRPEEVLGRNCRFLQGPATDRTQVRSIARRLAAGREVHTVLLNYRKDGSFFWNEVDITPLLDSSGRVTHFVGNQADVTERVQRQEHSSYLTYHNDLTGLANRAHLLDRLPLELHRADQGGAGVALLVVDLDGFKDINHTLGHRAGDEALAEAASRLRSVARPGDLVARIGGDEFVMLMVGARDTVPQAAAAVLEDLHAALSEPMLLHGQEVRVGASIGVATYPADGATASELLDRADAAMSRPKSP